MAHVVTGTKILRDGGIPEPVVEFAYTHHGTQVVEYFWHKCREQGNPKGLTEEHFRYPGMKPQTKETAILMLVDSIEAASRTIEPPEHEKFEEMIQRIIFTKLRGGQLDECGLTLEDLRTLVVRMSDTLVNMFHHRIQYPWQEQRRVVTHCTTPRRRPGSSIARAREPRRSRRDRTTRPAAPRRRRVTPLSSSAPIDRRRYAALARARASQRRTAHPPTPARRDELASEVHPSPTRGRSPMHERAELHEVALPRRDRRGAHLPVPRDEPRRARQHLDDPR